MQTVAPMRSFSAAEVSQREDHAGMQALGRVGRDDCVQTLRGRVEVAVLLDVAEKVHPEVIEAKVSDGDTRSDVFEFDDLILEFAQLFFAVSGVRTGRVENVVVTD